MPPMVATLHQLTALCPTGPVFTSSWQALSAGLPCGCRTSHQRSARPRGPLGGDRCAKGVPLTQKNAKHPDINKVILVKTLGRRQVEFVAMLSISMRSELLQGHATRV